MRGRNKRGSALIIGPFSKRTFRVWYDIINPIDRKEFIGDDFRVQSWGNMKFAAPGRFAGPSSNVAAAANWFDISTNSVSDSSDSSLLALLRLLLVNSDLLALFLLVIFGQIRTTGRRI